MRRSSAEEANEDAACRRTAAANEDDNGPRHTNSYIVLPTPGPSYQVNRPARTPRYLCEAAAEKHFVDAFGLSWGTPEALKDHMMAVPWAGNRQGRHLPAPFLA